MHRLVALVLTASIVVYSAAIILIVSARAQEPPPQIKRPAEYTLTVTPEDVATIARGLDELPAKISVPLTRRLISQIEAQNAAANPPAKPKE